MKKYNLIFLALICSIFQGCTIDQGVTNYEIDSPWNSPNTKAKTSSHTYLRYMAAGSSSDLYWTYFSGRKVKVKKFAKKLERYLFKSGHMDSWETTGGSIDDIESKYSPYRIFFVSIDPTIVLMVPWEPEFNLSRRTHGMYSNPRQQIGSKYLVFPFEFGTEVPDKGEGIAIDLDNLYEQKVKFSTERKTINIDFKDTSLTLSKNKLGWQVKRNK